MEQPNPPSRAIALPTLLEAMQRGTLAIQGAMPWSSNYTFLGVITDGDLHVPVIYKPQKGETPLWDFPQGTLYKREVAAYVVSAALGWNLVPPTVVCDGPHGIGSAQLLIRADYDQHYFTLREEHDGQLRQIALFDVVINNADRKGGHVLLDDDGHLWGIDHGIAFHNEYKLRTVLWDWANQAITEEERAALVQLDAQLHAEQPLSNALSELLYPREMLALRQRTANILEKGQFPAPRGPRSTPWPPV